MRRMPDGTWYNERTGVLEAPLSQPGAPLYKREVAPAGPRGIPLQAAAPDPQGMMISGLGASPMPGWQQLHMRQGRNYSALGVLDSLSPTMRKIVAVGAVIGVAALTVWLNRKGAGKSIKKSK